MVIEAKSDINVKDWIKLSSIMIGALLTILALIWQFRPANGIITVTFLMMIAFILFINSVSGNSRARFEAEIGTSAIKVNRFVRFAEYTFGLGMTFIIISFSILGYQYLSDFTNRNIIALILPIVFNVTAWILLVIYNGIGKSIINLKRYLWVLIELGCLILIGLDYFQVFSIP